MSSSQLLSQVTELSAMLGELDADVAEIKDQLRSLAGEDELPVVLPECFDPATAGRVSRSRRPLCDEITLLKIIS